MPTLQEKLDGLDLIPTYVHASHKPQPIQNLLETANLIYTIIGKSDARANREFGEALAEAITTSQSPLASRSLDSLLDWFEVMVKRTELLAKQHVDDGGQRYGEDISRLAEITSLANHRIGAIALSVLTGVCDSLTKVFEAASSNEVANRIRGKLYETMLPPLEDSLRTSETGLIDLHNLIKHSCRISAAEEGFEDLRSDIFPKLP